MLLGPRALDASLARDALRSGGAPPHSALFAFAAAIARQRAGRRYRARRRRAAARAADEQRRLEAERLTRLVDDVLLFSNLQRGVPAPAGTLATLDEVVGDVLRLVRPVVEERGAQLVVDVDDAAGALRRLVERGIAVTEFAPAVGDLEQTFLDLRGGESA